MTNKYLTKIAALTYPRIQHTEFDAAFQGDANPTRDMIEEYAHQKDRENFHTDYESWEEEHANLLRDPDVTKEEVHSHWEEEPNFDDYRGKTLEALWVSHRSLDSLAGKEVPGVNKIGTGLGYVLGSGALAAGIYAKNPLLGIAGLAGIGLGEVVRRTTSPEARLNFYNRRAAALEGNKKQLLDASRGNT